LARLRELDSGGTVAVFPSDHHFADEAGFAACMETAFEAAEVRPDRVILLGITPDSPEAGYGWVEPGVPLGGSLPDSVCHVARFWEKPSRSLASTLMKIGCLWNSFVMVGRIDTFIDLTQRALPTLMSAFESIRPALFTAREGAAVNDLYTHIPLISFSDQVLSTHPYELAMVCTTSLGWSDLGEAARVLALMKRTRLKTEWEDTRAGISSAAAG
jgi:mannose-1-phosphate guanylyltransferase